MNKLKNQTAKLVLIFLWPIILLTIGVLYCLDFSGFSISKIRSPLSYNEEWNIRPSHKEDPSLVQNVLSQNFSYLDSGSRCYSFVSADQKYVIKFFKMKHLLAKNWLNYIPIPKILDEYRFVKVDQRNSNLNDIFASCKLAFDEMQEETGLLYAHLNKTRDLKKKMQLVDDNGKKYIVDLDGMEFVIQKKATPFSEKIKKCMERNDIPAARKVLRSFLYLVIDTNRKGILTMCSGVGNISRNYGFIGDGCVHLDVICFRKTDDTRLLEAELIKTYQFLKEWIDERYPELNDFFINDVDDLL